MKGNNALCVCRCPARHCLVYKDTECCTTMLLRKISSATIQHCRSSHKMHDAAMKQNKICFFMAFYRHTICLNRFNKTLLSFSVFVSLAVNYQTDHKL